MALIGEMQYLTIGGNTYSIPTSGGSTVTVTRSLTSGTKTATISVDGTSYDLYAPTPNAGTITSVKTTAGAHTTINVSSGAANFNVPTKTSHLTNDSGFLTSSDIASVMKYKGTKATVSALPTSGNTTGDVWHVTADGSEWAWDGNTWQELGTVIDLSGYAQLAGASFTGPVTFGDSISVDEATIGDLVVNGAASFTNNINANTINGVTVGNSPKFTDTVTTVTTTGSGNAITAISATNGAITATKGTTFLTSHQDISGKADKSATVSNVAYDSTNAKITKTINGTTSDVVTVATLKSALGSMPASDVYSWAKASSKPTYTASEVGALASSTTYVSTITTTAGTHSAISSKSGAVSFNVPTKTSHLTNDSGFLTGITSSQVTTALGYTPYNSTNPNGYTSNTGTVTKVTAGTGLSIGTTAGGNFTTSGTINHTNSVTAQTTQAVYPIKIDAQGHISAYGSAVTSMPASDVYSWAKASTKPTYTASEVGALPSTTVIPTITDTYSGTSSNGMSGKAVKSAIDALDGSITGSAGTGKTLTAFSQTDGKVTATFGDISITKSQISDFPTIPTYYYLGVDNTSTSEQFYQYFSNLLTFKAGDNMSLTLHESNSTRTIIFNASVPTKVSELTNDSGYITASHTSTYSLPLAASGTRGGVRIGYSESGTNYAVKLSSEKMYVTVPWTDTKVTTAALTSGTTYYPILATGTGTATRQIDSTLGGLQYISSGGTASTTGIAVLKLGNATPELNTNNEKGILRLYGSLQYYTDLVSGAPSTNRTIILPDASGTVALTSNIPTVYVSTVTTTAGTHSAISNKSGAVSFNVPTATSHLTNDSNFTTTSQIASGYVELSATVASNSYTDITVSFGKTFSSAPTVVAGFYSTSTAGAFGRCCCAVHTITTTGCKIRIFNGDTAARQPAFYWIATNIT